MTPRPTSLILRAVCADSLKQQLEQARFERALEVAESLAEHRALLTTAELARMNQITSGKNTDPWRQDTVTLTLPSGRKETLAVIADPKQLAREKLHRATAIAEAGGGIDAAIDIYTGLVMAHVFTDANRRTAALASHYFLKRYGAPISGTELHELGLGDLRETGQLEAFRESVHQMVKFAEKRAQAKKE